MYTTQGGQIISYTCPTTGIAVPTCIEFINTWEDVPQQTLETIRSNMMGAYISTPQTQEILRTIHYVMYYNARMRRLCDACILTLHDIDLPSHKADQSMRTQDAIEEYLASEAETMSYCMTRHILSTYNITYIEEE